MVSPPRTELRAGGTRPLALLGSVGAELLYLKARDVPGRAMELPDNLRDHVTIATLRQKDVRCRIFAALKNHNFLCDVPAEHLYWQSLRVRHGGPLCPPTQHCELVETQFPASMLKSGRGFRAGC